MTAAPTVPPEVDEYLAAVRAALADVPAGERDDLLAEVETSLVEAAAEGGSSLVAQLGPPEDFAAELRTAAGLHAAELPPRDSALARRLRTVAAAVRTHPTVGAARRVASDLAPIWWVARAYVAVGALALLVDADWSIRYPIVPRIGTGEVALALIVGATLASVTLGLRARRMGAAFPRGALALNAALLVAAVPVAARAADTSQQEAQLASASSRAAELASAFDQSQTGLFFDGAPVHNIYPFTRDGRLLHDVLLYDGRGRPIEIRTTRALDPNRRFVITNGNRMLFNVFPIRYYEPGTKRVARPNAAPYVEHPLVLTPAVRRATP